MTHKIKLAESFADPVLSGDKCFEIRRNDRGYQKGDLVKFTVTSGGGYKRISHPLDDELFQITYVIKPSALWKRSANWA
jgi:hypothetical protein